MGATTHFVCDTTAEATLCKMLEVHVPWHGINFYPVDPLNVVTYEIQYKIHLPRLYQKEDVLGNGVL